MQKTLHRIFCGVAAILFMDGPAAQATIPLKSDSVVFDSPALYALYEKYPNYHGVFDAYALKQGFKRPYERIGTILHELIHIDSMVHQGFFIDGVYYDPYLDSSTWPKMNNADISVLLQNSKINHRIYWHYVRNTPSNTLANALDEINAYTHVTAWICRHDETSAVKQIDNLKGFIWLVNTYLQLIYIHTPEDHAVLINTPSTLSMLNLLLLRANTVLHDCDRGTDINQ